MTMVLAFLLAAAVVAALAALVAMIGTLCAPYHSLHAPAAPRAPETPAPARIESLGEICQRDGVLITSEDRLRAAVTLADTMILRGDLHGHPMPMQAVRADADRFAAAQSAPDATLQMLERCDETLLHRYPHGYWLISAALVRAAVAKRNAQDRK